jgi:hypothetical protein
MADIGEVDFEVFKELTMRRATESTTYNDVLREILGLSPRKVNTEPATKALNGAWEYRSVRFPNGTDFRAKYKGKIYTASVEGGRLVLDGESVGSPSEAAHKITGTNVNGWRFWECRLPTESRWRVIEALR